MTDLPWVPPGGPLAPTIDPAEVDPRELRAMQVVQAADVLDAWRGRFARYGTTVDYCGCPDYAHHWRRPGFACKHMRALKLLEARPGGRP